MLALTQLVALEGWTIKARNSGKKKCRLGVYGVKKYGDMKIVCRKTRNYHEV